MTIRKTGTKRGTTSKTAEAAAPRADVYERVTARIIKQLEAGTRPWHRPWNLKTVPLTRPLRHNGEAYRGINTLLLWMEAQSSGFTSNYWMTYKQAQELGGQVRKGEKAATVVYSGAIERTEQNEKGEDEESRIPFLKSYSVFNADQIDGLPERYRAVKLEPNTPLDQTLRIENADEFFTNTGADIRHGGDKAFYSPDADFVQLPMWEDFESAERFCSTMAHELIHRSGHKSRLDRDIRNAFGSADYAREELVAELGACFICADLGVFVEPREVHAAYLASWLKVLKDDKRAIFRAAAHAERAATHLHDRQPAAAQYGPEQPAEDHAEAA
jgi:antirestriction protein ArdC